MLEKIILDRCEELANAGFQHIYDDDEILLPVKSIDELKKIALQESVDLAFALGIINGESLEFEVFPAIFITDNNILQEHLVLETAVFQDESDQLKIFSCVSFLETSGTILELEINSSSTSA